MLRRYKAPILVLAALGVLFAGPVAACLCVDEPMPCCPDEPEPAQHPNDACATHVAAPCEATPPETLLPSAPDSPQPAASVAPAWYEHAPPVTAAPPTPEPYASPPIYLVTLRLRN
jgi:hypothetical protein